MIDAIVKPNDSVKEANDNVTGMFAMIGPQLRAMPDNVRFDAIYDIIRVVKLARQ